MNLHSVIRKNLVCMLDSRSKGEALDTLTILISRELKIADVDAIRQGILQREKLMSTGIGLGIAIPHVRLDSYTGLEVAVGLAPTGLADYEAIDDKPVRLIFLVVAGRNQHKPYIQLMSSLVAKVKKHEISNALFAAQSPDELYRLLVD